MDGSGGFEQGVDVWMRTDPSLEELEEAASRAAIDPAQVENAIDTCTHEDPRRDVVKLILAATAAADAQAARAELSQLKSLGEIKSRAETWGVDMEELKKVVRAAKGGGPRVAAVEFITNAIASGAAQGTAERAPKHFKVVAEKGAIVRAGIDKASNKVDTIQQNTVIEVSELKRTTTGTLRAKTKGGWVTAVTKTDRELLAEMDETEMTPAGGESLEQVTIPKGVSAGEEMTVEVNGEDYTVVVPHGLEPGDTFEFECEPAASESPSQPQPEPEPAPSSKKFDDGLGAAPSAKAPTPQRAQPQPVPQLEPEPQPSVAEDLTASAPAQLERVMSDVDRERLEDLKSKTGEELKVMLTKHCSHLVHDDMKGRSAIVQLCKDGSPEAVDEAALRIMWAWKDGEAAEARDLRRQISYGRSSGQEKTQMSAAFGASDIRARRGLGKGSVAEETAEEYAIKHARVLD